MLLHIGSGGMPCFLCHQLPSVPACTDATQLATAPRLARVVMAGDGTPQYELEQRLQHLLPNVVVSHLPE